MLTTKWMMRFFRRISFNKYTIYGEKMLFWYNNTELCRGVLWKPLSECHESEINWTIDELYRRWIHIIMYERNTIYSCITFFNVNRHKDVMWFCKCCSSVASKVGLHSQKNIIRSIMEYVRSNSNLMRNYDWHNLSLRSSILDVQFEKRCWQSTGPSIL